MTRNKDGTVTMKSANISFKEFFKEHEYTYDDLNVRSLNNKSHPEVQDRMKAAAAFVKDTESSKAKISLGNRRIVVSKYRQPPIATPIKNQDIKIDHHYGRKPIGGLWYGIGSGWLDFAYNNVPTMIHMFIHELILDTNKIAIINSKASNDNFEKRYGFEFYLTRDGKRGKKHLIKLNDKEKTQSDLFSLGQSAAVFPPETLMNWPDVEKEYFGVEISGGGLKSYQWQETWDLPSGVVWNQSAVKNTRLLYIYNTKTKEYVKPNSLGIYAGKSQSSQNPLPPANNEATDEIPRDGIHN